MESNIPGQRKSYEEMARESARSIANSLVLNMPTEVPAPSRTGLSFQVTLFEEENQPRLEVRVAQSTYVTIFIGDIEGNLIESMEYSVNGDQLEPIGHIRKGYDEHHIEEVRFSSSLVLIGSRLG